MSVKSESVERFASESENVVVCKSMSKVYALSGLRVGYLCGPPSMIGPLSLFNPPWSVSLPGQIAAVAALQDPDYYCQRFRETHDLRTRLADDLLALGDLQVTPGVANYLLCQLPAGGPTARTVIERCRRDNLFLRDASATSASLGPRSARIAVKDATTNRRMVDILGPYPERKLRLKASELRCRPRTPSGGGSRRRTACCRSLRTRTVSPRRLRRCTCCPAYRRFVSSMSRRQRLRNSGRRPYLPPPGNAQRLGGPFSTDVMWDLCPRSRSRRTAFSCRSSRTARATFVMPCSRIAE